MPSRAGGNRIYGQLVLSGALPAASSRATVSLIDATHADAPATIVAQAVIRVTSPQSGPIDFCLEGLPDRPAKRRWLFDAVVTADPNGELSVGDYVLGYAVTYPEQPDSSPVLLNLQRVN